MWLIQAENITDAIRLDVVDAAIEYHADCAYDMGEVFDGQSNICFIYTVMLTLYRTILTFNDPQNQVFFFSKHCGKRRKCWLSAFSPLATMFSTLPKTNFIFFSVTFILSSGSCFDFGLSKILSFGRVKVLWFPPRPGG